MKIQVWEDSKSGVAGKTATLYFSLFLWYNSIIDEIERKERGKKMAKSRFVTEEEKVLMNELYAKIGTYAGVAREVGRAPSTVKRYIVEVEEKETNESAEIFALTHFSESPLPIEEVAEKLTAFLANGELRDLTLIQEDEKEEYEFMRGLLL